MKSNIYAYEYGDNLYINLTNSCCNSCEFCVRNDAETFEGHNLWLTHEPSADEVIEAMGDLSKYDEIVMCGFGEPTDRLFVLLQVAMYAKSADKHVRINTNGLANLVHGRDVTPMLKGLIDVVSISLNAPDAESYDKLCHPSFGEAAYDALLDFAVKCKQYVPRVVLSVVDIMPAEDIEKCRRITERLGVEFRVRRHS